MDKLYEISSSSSSKSKNNGKSVEDIVKKFEKTTIRTCVVGISKIIGRGISHSALYLSDKAANKLDNSDNEDGIIIEYGQYFPGKNEEEMQDVEKGAVIYRYGTNYGGLRYFINDLITFKTDFGDVAYMILEVSKDNQISFSYLIDKIAPIKEKTWIAKNYWLTKFVKETFNCRTFIAHAINIIKPIYDSDYIVRAERYEKKQCKGESLIPEEILKVLKKYER